jgi:phosphohistidine phosphatase SixA
VFQNYRFVEEGHFIHWQSVGVLCTDSDHGSHKFLLTWPNKNGYLICSYFQEVAMDVTVCFIFSHQPLLQAGAARTNGQSQGLEHSLKKV